MNREVPPAPDEFEVSIIGPGVGECVLLHLGNNEWCVVDSCIPTGSSEPAAIQYLKSFGNDALKGIKLVLATHWHDDHIKGLATILEAAPDAKFVCSAALDNDMFRQLVASSEENVDPTTGLEEFSAIFQRLMARRTPTTPKHLVAPILATSQRHLLTIPAAAGRPFAVSVISLSPSDGTISAAHGYFKTLLPKPGERQVSIPAQGPNKTSVVLLVTAGPRIVLLGGDLEHTKNDGEGWAAVVAAFPRNTLAEVFKVPHHGSENGHCADVWEKLLTDNPVALIAPYTPSSLPTPKDIRRICKLTQRAYATNQKIRRPPRRDVDKDINAAVKTRRALLGEPGHVRVRWPGNSATAVPTIEMFHGGVPLCVAQK